MCPPLLKGKGFLAGGLLVIGDSAQLEGQRASMTT